MSAGYAREGWRIGACSGSIGGQASDVNPVNGPNAYAFVLAQSGNTTVAEGGRHCNTPAEDGKEAGVSCLTNILPLSF